MSPENTGFEPPPPLIYLGERSIPNNLMTFLRSSDPFTAPVHPAHRGLFARLALLSALCLLAPPTLAQGHFSVLPFYGTVDTNSFFLIELDDGRTTLVDRLDRNPPRRSPLRQNPFREIGRPDDQKGYPGEILLTGIRDGDGSLQAVLFVESSTGYVAFFDTPGRSNQLGELSTALGRPFGPLATTDGNYALIPQRDSSGRTVGAYLYHATTGQGLHLDGLRKLEIDGAVTPTTPLPQLQGRVAATALQSSREETVGFLFADSGDGSLYYADVNGRDPARLVHRQLPQKLFDTLPATGPHSTPQRLVAVPIQAGDASTRHVLFLDVASGSMALLQSLDQNTTLVGLASNLYDLLGTEPATVQRTFTAIPHIEDDATRGVWVLDSVTGRLLYIESPNRPGAVTVRPVANFGR